MEHLSLDSAALTPGEAGLLTNKEADLKATEKLAGRLDPRRAPAPRQPHCLLVRAVWRVRPAGQPRFARLRHLSQLRRPDRVRLAFRSEPVQTGQEPANFRTTPGETQPTSSTYSGHLAPKDIRPAKPTTLASTHRRSLSRHSLKRPPRRFDKLSLSFTGERLRIGSAQGGTPAL